MTGEVCKLSPLSKGKIANLVGKSCLINCTINELTVQALWDTGAQVSLVNELWWKETFPECSVRSLEELINEKLTVFFCEWVKYSIQWMGRVCGNYRETDYHHPISGDTSCGQGPSDHRIQCD